jgi:hypothetical protein
LLLNPVQVRVKLKRESGIAKEARFVSALVILGSQYLAEVVPNV